MIFVVGAPVAKGASRAMGESSVGKIAASVLPALVMVIALFIILEQFRSPRTS